MLPNEDKTDGQWDITNPSCSLLGIGPELKPRLSHAVTKKLESRVPNDESNMIPPLLPSERDELNSTIFLAYRYRKMCYYPCGVMLTPFFNRIPSPIKPVMESMRRFQFNLNKVPL